ncbi:MAG TPA: hypothetical protein PLB10_06420 [Thiolinea sp.]|nr:hypothetical protein [Thiolinea sp.]
MKTRTLLSLTGLLAAAALLQGCSPPGYGPSPRDIASSMMVVPGPTHLAISASDHGRTSVSMGFGALVGSGYGYYGPRYGGYRGYPYRHYRRPYRHYRPFRPYRPRW